MAVDVRTGPAFAAGTPKPLFQVRFSIGFMPYAVTADGQRFLIATSTDETRAALTVLLDWTTALKP